MKKVITAAVIFIALGAVAFVGALAFSGWDFEMLSTENYVTNEYTVSENFKNITVIDNTADVTLLTSSEGEVKVVCYEDENEKHTVFTESDTLFIKKVKNKKWYQYIGISFKSPKVTVYIPEGEYERLSVELDTGDLSLPEGFIFESVKLESDTGDVSFAATVRSRAEIETDTGKVTFSGSAKSLDISCETGNITLTPNATLGDIELDVDTGKISLSAVRCDSLKIESDTGSVTLRDVIATGNFGIETDTGKVTFDACDAANITVKTDTGDVRGTLLSKMHFIAKSRTGDVNVPETVSEKTCRINSSTGDIKISIAE